MNLDPRLGNLSFTGAGIGRDSILAKAASGGIWRGDIPCGCCGAKVVSEELAVCGTCRRQGDEPWQGREWCNKVKAAIHRFNSARREA